MTFIAFSLVAPTGIAAASFVVGGALGAALSRKSRSPVASGGVAARRRTGRLPLPQQVAELASREAPTLDRVNAFVDRLAELPLTAWLEIGRSLAVDADFQAARSTARAILDATIADRELSIAAWYAKDAVETSAFLASHPSGRLSPPERRAFAAAHGAAEVAALALLAEDHLSAADFAVLYLPFADEVPAGTSRI
jgi:hypothetical protein